MNTHRRHEGGTQEDSMTRIAVGAALAALAYLAACSLTVAWLTTTRED